MGMERSHPDKGCSKEQILKLVNAGYTKPEIDKLCLESSVARQTPGEDNSSKPSESNAKNIIEQKVNQESEGKIRLVSFRKTNGQTREVYGVKVYVLEYEAVIEFLDDCKWLTVDPFSARHIGFKTVQTKRSAEKKGGYWAGWMNLTQTPGTEHKKGERQNYFSSIRFEKTEKGWRPTN